MDFAVGVSLADDVVDFAPSVSLLLVHNYQSLSFPVGSGCPSRSVHIGISIYRHSHLNDVADSEVKTSGCNVGSN